MSTQMQTCSVCGSQMPVGSKFCQNCGHAMSQGEDPSARAEGITPPQGAPTTYVAPQYGPDPTPYQPQPNTTSWQPGQHGEAPRQPQYAPPNQGYAPPPPALYGQQPPANQGYAPPPQNYSNAPYGSYAPGQYAAQPPRDSTLALLLELIGYVGVLGIGHIYAGRTTRGVSLLVGWLFYGAIIFVLFFTLIGAPIACLMALIWPVVPILSGIWAKVDLDKERAAYGPRY
ncbi:MAG TPA: zinc-ribbon domain-containing protein [Chloroflexia bacterium]